MKEKINEMWLKYKEIVLYLIFGGGTTVINIFVYFICAHPFGINTVLSTCIAWVLSVLFAYVTNKMWVFESKAVNAKAIMREVISFFSCRLLTGFLDVVLMYVFVDILSCNDLLMKIIANIIVIILNYVASKLLIFKKSK